MSSTHKTSSRPKQKIKINEDSPPSLQPREPPRRHISTTKQKDEVDEDDTSPQEPDSDSPPPVSSTHKNPSGFKQNMKADEEASTSQGRGTTSLRRGEACHVCRSKRQRCDGVKPTCGYCTRRGYNCEYDDPATWGRERQMQLQIDQLTADLAAANRELVVLRQALGNRQPNPNNPRSANRPYSHLPQAFSQLTLDDSSTPAGQQRTRAGSRPSTYSAASPSSSRSYPDSPSTDEGNSFSGSAQSSPSPPYTKQT